MTRKKIILIVGAAVVVLAGGATAVTIWGWNPPPPDPNTAKPEEVAKFLASDQFAKMPVEKKQEYAQKLHRNPNRDRRQMRQVHDSLSEKEREKLHENMRSMFMAHMQKEVDGYFDLPEDQRAAYLDRIIDEHEQRRQRWQNRPPPDRNRDGNENRREGRRRPSRSDRNERHKQRIKNSDGKARARRMAFMEAMRKRRKERGLPDWRPHGPGRH